MLYPIKSSQLIVRVLRLITAAVGGLSILAGCSGGYGSGGSYSSGSTGIPYTGNTAQAVITTTNAAKLAGHVVGTAEASDVIVVPVGILMSNRSTARESSSETGVARLITTYVHDTLMRVASQSMAPKVSAAVPVDETFACDSGSIHVTGTLNTDGTGVLTASYTSCRLGEDTISGSVTIRVDAFDMVSMTPTDATFDFTLLTLTAPSLTESVSGTLRDQLSIASNTETLTVNIVTRNDLTGETDKTENLVIVAVYDNIVAPNLFTETIAGRTFDSVEGYVDITTPVPLVFGSVNQFFPNQGQLLLTGAGGASIRVSALSAVLIKLELDLNGDSTYERSAFLKWTDLGGAVGADLGDNDGDGMHNSWETVNSLDPLSAADAALDKDGDGFTNLQEYQAGTAPNLSTSTPLSADLAISIIPVGAVVVGTPFSNFVAVVNWGPMTASGVVVTYVLPAGLNLVSATASQGSCSGVTTVTCTLGPLGVGSTSSIEISVTPAVAGVRNVTATVSSSTPEGDASNNSASATITVQ